MNVSDGIVYPDRESWLANRGIGASDVASICAENPYKSPYAWWAEASGLIPRTEETMAMRYGHAIENFITDEFSRETRLKLYDQGDFAVFSDKSCKHLRCTPDRLIVDRDGDILGVVELKAMDSIGFSRIDGEIPLSYQIQVQAQMACCECDVGYIAMLVGAGKKLEVMRIDRHEKMINAIRRKVIEFAKRVAEKNPPPVDAMESTQSALRKIHSEDNGETIDINDAGVLFDMWKDLGLKEKEIEAKKTELRNKFMDILKGNTFGVSDRGKVSWKTQTRKGRIGINKEYVDAVIMAGIPFTLDDDSTTRVLRVNPVKGEEQ